MKEYINGFTFLPGPLQRIIPINPDKGIYMISYNDNKNTLKLKKYLKNTLKNRIFYQEQLEKALGITKDSLNIIALRSYYWTFGTHYYKPLNTKLYRNREEFIYSAQHPDNHILVVGEAVSRNHGWVEGALESVKEILNKKWIKI